MPEHATFECSNSFTHTTAISYSFMNPLLVSLQTMFVKCFSTLITIHSFLLCTYFVSIQLLMNFITSLFNCFFTFNTINSYSFMNPLLVSLQTMFVKCFSTLITIYSFLLGTYFVSIQLLGNFITSLLV